MKRYNYIFFILSLFLMPFLLHSNESVSVDYENYIPKEIDYKTFNEKIFVKLPTPEDKILFLTSFLQNEDRTLYKFVTGISPDTKKAIYQKLIEIGYISKIDEATNESVDNSGESEIGFFKMQGKRFYFSGKQVRYNGEFKNILKRVPKAELLYSDSRKFLWLGVGFLFPSITNGLVTVISSSFIIFSPFSPALFVGVSFLIITIVGFALTGYFFYKSKKRKLESLIYYNKKMKQLLNKNVGFDVNINIGNENELGFTVLASFKL